MEGDRLLKTRSYSPDHLPCQKYGVCDGGQSAVVSARAPRAVYFRTKMKGLAQGLKDGRLYHFCNFQFFKVRRHGRVVGRIRLNDGEVRGYGKVPQDLVARGTFGNGIYR